MKRKRNKYFAEMLLLDFLKLFFAHINTIQPKRQIMFLLLLYRLIIIFV